MRDRFAVPFFVRIASPATYRFEMEKRVIAANTDSKIDGPPKFDGPLFFEVAFHARLNR